MGKHPAFQLWPFLSLEDTVLCNDVSFPRLWGMAGAVTQAPDVGGGGVQGVWEAWMEMGKECQGRADGSGDPPAYVVA